MTDIVLYNKIENPVQAAIQLGEAFAKSGMFGCTRSEQGTVLAFTCMCERSSPTELLRRYHLTNDGKLTRRADSVLTDFRERGGKHKWIRTGDEPVANPDDRVATVQLKYDGETLEVSYSMREAKAAGLIKEKSAWVKSPADMLRATVIRKGVRMLAPEVFAGGVPEEAMEQEHAPQLVLTPAAAPAHAVVKQMPPDLVDAEVIAPVVTLPVAPPVEAPAPAPVVDLNLADEVANMLSADECAKAVTWMVKQGWIGKDVDLTGNPFSAVKPVNLVKIKSNVAAFRNAISR
jgi:hypothetical protein